MAQHQISVSALILAPARQVYAIIVDYEVGHPSILPKPPFVSLTVERGGIGAGTLINLQMRLLGRLQTYRGEITEPEPGRVLVETYLGTGMVTTFRVESRDDGQRSQVTIVTDTKVRDGILGVVEGWLSTQLLRPTYVKELAQLAAIATR